MCDGTPCPCNLYPPGHPDSRYPNGRPSRAPQIRRAATRAGLIGSALTVAWAVLIVVTGWGVFDLLGPVTIALSLLAFLVALVTLLVELGPRVAARHRHAARQSRQ